MPEANSHLRLEVFVTPAKPINPSFLPNAPEGGLTWPPTTATLISGRHDAVLVDALFTRDEAHDLGRWIAASGKRLTTIYITHGHSDHYFGLTTLREQFPTAKVVALPSVANAIDPGGVGLSPVARAKAMFGDQVPDHPVRPEPMDSPGIKLEGHDLVTMEMGRSDADISTILYVPSLRAVVAGEIAYNDVHVNVAATNRAGRQAWIDALKKIAGLGPVTVVAGHKRPGFDDGPRILGETITYLEDFDRCLAASSSAGELIRTMLELHGGRMNPTTLWNAAHIVFAAERTDAKAERSNGSV